MTVGRFTPETTRLDDAARAGWLYYVAGNTQDEIARKLGVSRQSAQRLVSLAVSERLVKVRLDHPIGRCMDLAGQLSERFGLQLAEVVPSDPDAPELLSGVAIAAAVEIERLLKSPEEKIVALGTGRALRAVVEQLPQMDCPQHRIVSRLGNMMLDGSATPYNAVIRMAERVGARHYPYPLPVVAHDQDELRGMLEQEPVRNTMALCARADLTLVGIGQMDDSAPLHVDGFLTRAELEAVAAAGAAGEITSWIFDDQGRIIDCDFNRRVASAPLEQAGDQLVIGVAVGPSKLPSLRAALRGRLINGVVTNEATAEGLLQQR
ncbi:sugar-binding transcriptional regulator [Pseudoroseicyclus aestuarii]|uniref:DNA-binding transcriptional regulator LsrR (DeoR family) n=1 Tax=Pseudoroseicyclus aestuarii TaxID=1795041 RepID=A0A318T0L9_9RHOB|nr:sugar-binding transcriptional regulator [Pseudoroseicyclus aestuarii]PYE86169.1 DNA-binding transcriptional regulator LsrR (DeoR family) [Pseudoroseicyclus aestuarii]